MSDIDLRLKLRERELLLERCYHKINFLYSCLEKPEHNKHEHPEMTIDFLRTLSPFAKRRKFCPHSSHEPNCESCQERMKEYEFDLMCRTRSYFLNLQGERPLTEEETDLLEYWEARVREFLEERDNKIRENL